MTQWHVNEGLAPLIAQMKNKYPHIVVGTIGDAAHRTEHSDHNPNAFGRVNAADFMLGDSFTEAQALILAPLLTVDKRTHYVIHDRKIWTTETRAWKTYTGTDPHTNHIHLSVNDNAHTNTSPWAITVRDAIVQISDLLVNHNPDGKAPDTLLGKAALSQQAEDGIDGQLKMFYVAFANLGELVKTIDGKLDELLAK